MKIAIALGTSFLLAWAVAAAEPPNSPERLQAIVDRAVQATLDRFATSKLQSNQLAVTLIDLRPDTPARASYRGGVPLYPASVVKLFYLAATHRWMEDGRLTDTAELRRALRDMIVDSSNDATHYVLDALTGTTGGPELSAAEMKEWGEKRNAVNRYFASLGYTNINVNQKPWNEGPYGRERVWVGQGFTNRNMLTTEATARLMSEIARKEFVSGKACDAMLSLLARTAGDAKDGQARFTFGELPAGSKLYSKAGWTSTTRHDTAYVELPDGRRFVLVTFTVGHASNRQIIPFLARQVLDSL